MPLDIFGDCSSDISLEELRVDIIIGGGESLSLPAGPLRPIQLLPHWPSRCAERCRLWMAQFSLEKKSHKLRKNQLQKVP